MAAVEDFRRKWHAQWRDEPFALFVSNRAKLNEKDPRPGCGMVEMPLGDGDLFVVRLIPLTKSGVGDERYGLCLIREMLNVEQAGKLSNYVFAIKRLLELDEADCLAMMAYSFLFGTDFRRHMNGVDSILREPPGGFYKEPLTDDMKNWVSVSVPWRTVDHLLEYWGRAGFVEAFGLLAPPEGEDNRPTYTRIPARYLTAEEQSTLYGMSVRGADMVFTRVGRKRKVVYAGSEAEFKDQKGFKYLEILLRHPGREFTSTKLRYEISDGQSIIQSIDEESLREEGIYEDTGYTEEPDERYSAELRKELKRLSEQRSENEGDPVALAEIDAETQDIVRLAPYSGYRKDSGQAERDRNSVRKTISEALKKIQSEHPKFADHLNESIQSGTYWCYAPEKKPMWVF